MRQAALGLAHLHSRGLVHRDVKPHNLLASADRSVVKILDLGLERLEADPLQMTKGAGVTLGTPAYLAPEQATNPILADARSDVYSLGCTMYHLLTGRTPFRAATVEECARLHRDIAAEPIESFRSDLPAGLSTIVKRMMAKKPEDRFTGAAEVAAMLAPFAGVTEPGHGPSADAAVRPASEILAGHVPRSAALSDMPTPMIALPGQGSSSRPLLTTFGIVGIIALTVLGITAAGLAVYFSSAGPTKDPVLISQNKDFPMKITMRGGNPEAFTILHELNSASVTIDGKIEGAAVASHVLITKPGFKYEGPVDKSPQEYGTTIRNLLAWVDYKKKNQLPDPTGAIPKHWKQVKERAGMHVVAMPIKPSEEFASGYYVSIGRSPNKYVVFKTLAALISAEKAANPDELFRDNREKASGALHGRVEYLKDFRHGPYPAQEVHVNFVWPDMQRGIEFMRMYLVGNYLIFVHAQCVGPAPDEEVKQFHGTFSVLPTTRHLGRTAWQGKQVRYDIKAMPASTVSATSDAKRLTLHVNAHDVKREIVVSSEAVEHGGKKTTKDAWSSLDIVMHGDQPEFLFDRPQDKEKIENPLKTIPSITINQDRTFLAEHAGGSGNSLTMRGSWIPGSALPAAIEFAKGDANPARFKRVAEVPKELLGRVDYLLYEVEKLLPPPPTK